MAQCPKCGHKLHLYNVSQFCPGCGVNLRFYGFEENFYREAKLAELSQAGVHIKIRRLAAAFLGTNLCIARLCVMLLPAVALLLPAATAVILLPFKSEAVPLSALGLYNAFSGDDLSYILDMRSSVFCGDTFGALFRTMCLYAVPALFAVLVLLTSILCFISYKNMQKITCVLAALGFGSCAAAEVFVLRFVSACKDSLLLQAKNGFGLLVAAAMFIAVFIVNLLLWRKGIPVEYDEGMLERNEIYHKVKRGEINPDDLPQPVVETAATRAIDEEIEKQTREFNEKHTEEQEVTA